MGDATAGRISFSQYYMWSKCPYRWKLTYIDKHKESAPTIHTMFGTAIHETIQHYLVAMYNETIKAADEIDLNALLLTRMQEIYASQQQEYGQHFSNEQELFEFYNDGVAILKAFKKDRNKHFPRRGWELVGIEWEIDEPVENNVKIVGFIDVILREADTGKVRIIDLKTSTRGWSDYAKKDKEKVSQILIYKWFYSGAQSVDLGKIDVEYLILKRKLRENSEYPQSRLQRFVPSNGSVSVKRTVASLSEFIKNGFDPMGNHKVNGKFAALPSVSNCKYCEFKTRKDLCPVGIG